MLPSEELKAKIRQESAEPTTANNVEATPAAEPADKAPEQPKAEPQSATAPKPEGVKDNTEKTAPAQSSSTTDDRPRYQRDFEKRLHRQERSHQQTVKGLEDRIAELEKQLKDKTPELKAEDFASQKEWDEYQKNQLRDSLRKEILEELNTQAGAEKKAAERREEVNRKIEANFTDPKMRSEFNEVIKDFLEDEDDFLNSENGMLFQEIIDESPIGPLMAMKIAQSPKVIARMKQWSKDMLATQLNTFEKELLALKNAEKTKKAAPQQPTQGNPAKPSGIPSTGPIGTTGATSASFDAREWLRKNRPERYH